MRKPDAVGQILSDPLKTHFALKERGSSFAKIARSASSEKQPITSSIVRAVVYGVSLRHREIVFKEIRLVLAMPALRKHSK